MKKKTIFLLVGIVILALIATGLTGKGKKAVEPETTLEKRIASLEAEIAELKEMLSEGSRNLQVAKKDETIPVSGGPGPGPQPLAWTEGARGWQENGTDIWTSNLAYQVGIGTATPAYNLDINGDMRIMGGINDGVGLGTAGQVLISTGADVYWGASPAGVADYIWNQDTAQQSPANFWISGWGEADAGFVGLINADLGVGIYGKNFSAVGTGIAGSGNNTDPIVLASGSGVAGSGPNVGVFGNGDVTAQSWGVFGTSDAADGAGVVGIGTSAVGGQWMSGSGVSGSSDDVGVYGYGSTTAGSNGMWAESDAADGRGLMAAGNNLTPWTFSLGAGVEATGSDLGVVGFGDGAGSYGVYGKSQAVDGNGVMAAGNGLVPWTFSVGAGVEATGSDLGIVGFGDADFSIGVYGNGLGSGSVGTWGSGDLASGIGLVGTADAADGNGAFAVSGGAAWMGQPAGHDCGALGNGINWGVFGFGQNAASFGVGVTGLGAGTSNISYLTGGGGAFRGRAGICAYGENGAGAYIEVTDGAAWWALQLGNFIPGNMQEGVSDGWFAYKKCSKGIIALPAPSAINYEIIASGTAQIVDGSISVVFPYPFNELVSTEIPVIVTVTPTEECNGLYISQTKADGFVVKEANGGRTNASFNWIAIGREKGKEEIDYRAKNFDSIKEIKASTREVKKDLIAKKDTRIEKLSPKKDKGIKKTSLKKVELELKKGETSK